MPLKDKSIKQLTSLSVPSPGIAVDEVSTGGSG